MPEKKRGPFNRIMEILKFERKEITAIYFYAILAGLVQLTLPLGIQAIISFVLGGSLSTSLVLLIILVVFGVFIAGLLQVNQMKIIEKIQQQLFVRYSFNFSHLIHHIDMKQTRKYYLPELLNRFFDIVFLQKGISKLLLDIPTASIQIIFGLLLLSLYHPIFIFFGIMLILILFLILRFTGNKGLQTSLEESTNKYKMAAYLEEVGRMITSFKFIKESFQLKKADKHVADYLTARTSHFKILLIQYWTLIAFKILITAAMLVFGAVLLVDQQLNIGQFIAAEIVIILVINSVEKVIVNLDQVYDVLTSTEKINIVLEQPAEESGTDEVVSHNGGMNVRLQNLHFSYEEGIKVINGISLDIKPGEKVCFYGESGSGKSTLLQLIGGLYKPDTGKVYIDEVQSNKYNLSALRPQIGVMLSNTHIFSGTILENITLGSNVDKHFINQLTELTGLRKFIDDTPKGYDLMLSPGGIHLPDGVAEKILLIRALILKPRMLLLEDPLKNIESQYAAGIMKYICEELRGTTVVVATADNQHASFYDKMFMIKKGRIEELEDK